MRNPDAYHDNFKHRRKECLKLANFTCQHCGLKSGDSYISYGGQQLKVVLQAAHLNHDPLNEYAVLICLCKQCHMSYDMPKHLESTRSRIQKRKNKKVFDQIRAGQMVLPGFPEIPEEISCAVL